MAQLIKIIDMLNISRTPIQIGVSPPNLETEEVTGTDNLASDLTGSPLFDGFGLVTIQPSQRFIIEESRVNLGQIENYAKDGFLKIIFLTRDLSELTDIS